MLMLLMAGCAKDDSKNAEALLESVPADADYAVIVRTGRLLEKADCKVSDSKIELSKELRQIAEQIKEPSARETILEIADGKSGVNPEMFCIFQSSHALLTGLLTDPSAFKSFVEKKEGSSFEEENGVNVNGEYAYVGNRFWIGLEGRPSPEAISRYAKMSRNQSYLSREEATLLLDTDRELSGIADMRFVMQEQGRNRAQISMAMNMTFDNVSSLFFTAGIDKETLTATLSPVNAKGKPAKFLLPTGKVDVKKIASLGGKGSAIVAIALPHSLIDKFVGMLSSFGGGLPKDAAEAIGKIDGTTAFLLEPGNGVAEGIVSTSSKPTPQLVEMIARMSGLVVTVRDDAMLLSSGKAEAAGGKLEAAQEAELFKGAMAGMVADAGFIPAIGGQQVVSEGVRIMLVPADGSLELRFSAKFDKKSLLEACKGLVK